MPQRGRPGFNTIAPKPPQQPHPRAIAVTPHRHPSSTHRASAQAHCARRGHRGFTLIEVMIVVAIVAILAAVALPNYINYVRRGQLPEGPAALSDFRVKMEQYYQDNRNYGTTNCADVSPPSWATSTPTLTYVAAKYFGYSCALTNGGQGYTLMATGSTGRAVGTTYTLNSANSQGTTSFAGVAVGKTCWLVRGNEC
jgi:type IV pilus assembly protein PilE